MTEEPIQCLSLYYHAGPKALLFPFSERSSVAFSGATTKNNDPTLLSLAQKTPRNGALRLKFSSGPHAHLLWVDYHAASIQSHACFMDLLAAQQRSNMQYLCCADLNIRGTAAGTHFFQRFHPAVADTAQREEEMACIQLANTDKIRFLRLPPDEQAGLGRTIAKYWSQHGARRADKYGVPVYKLNHQPWLTAETSKDKCNVAARKLVLAMLFYMDQNGWTRVVPFDCTTSERDADSLVFFRDRQYAKPSNSNFSREFCAVSLERQHKIRLIGGSDEMTRTAFENAARQHWMNRLVQETNRFPDNVQIKLVGQPWCPQTTPQNIASAKLVCGILQDLWHLGWRWHCAVDLSCSVADKSTFFLSRDVREDDDMKGGQIACVQPKGKGKVNLVCFPSRALEKALDTIRRTRWCTPLVKIERHGTDSATCHFMSQSLHYSQRTDEKIVTAKVYNELLCIAGTSAEGTTMLGTADISGNNYTRRDSNGNTKNYSLDTDAFFLWYPSTM